jgi:aminopeptidase N
VTCKWWDDLWLNEAMATWLSYKPFGDDYYSDWNMVEHFVFLMINFNFVVL